MIGEALRLGGPEEKFLADELMKKEKRNIDLDRRIREILEGIPPEEQKQIIASAKSLFENNERPPEEGSSEYFDAIRKVHEQFVIDADPEKRKMQEQEEYAQRIIEEAVPAISKTMKEELSEIFEDKEEVEMISHTDLAKVLERAIHDYREAASIGFEFDTGNYNSGEVDALYEVQAAVDEAGRQLETDIGKSSGLSEEQIKKVQDALKESIIGQLETMVEQYK